MSHRTRHLILHFGPGETLPQALQEKLEEAGVRAGWIQGVGVLDNAEIALFDPRSRAYGQARRIAGPATVVSLQGNVATAGDRVVARLFATLAREGDSGLTTIAGELSLAEVFDVEVWVTAFDDIALRRTADERTGLFALTAASEIAAAPQVAPAAPAPAPPAPAARPSSPRPASAPSSDAPRPQAPAMSAPTSPSPSPMNVADAPPAMPQRINRAKDMEEIYPEIGDTVTHFHFGECNIIGSDGDRIRLQQTKDQRVREVALSALKIDLVREDVASGKRHFNLLRKN